MVRCGTSERRRWHREPFESDSQPQPYDVVAVIGFKATSHFHSKRHAVAEPIVDASSEVDPGPAIEPILCGTGTSNAGNNEKNETGRLRDEMIGNVERAAGHGGVSITQYLNLLVS